MRARWDYVCLGLIVVVFGAVCYATLGHQSFDSGETITAGYVIHPSYAQTFKVLAASERSGPVYYSLAWAWSHLFGMGEVALRSLSEIFALGTIVAMFFAGRELMSRRLGVLAALIAACNPDIFWYSQEARSYPVYIFFSAAALYFFIRALKRPSRAAYAGWALAGALALATHYFSAFSIGIEALWLLAANRRRIRAPLTAIGTVALVGLALVPLAIHQERSGRPNAFTAVPVLERGASALVKFAAGEVDRPSGEWSKLPLLAREGGIVVLILFAAAIAFLFIRARGSDRRLSLAVGSVALLAFTIPIGIALAGKDYVEPRNLIGSLTPLLLLIAAGVEMAIRALGGLRAGGGVRLAPALAVSAPMVAIVALTSVTPDLQRQNWRAVSRAALASAPVGVVATQPANVGRTLDYFFGKNLPPLTRTAFPCGVTARRIVTITASPAKTPESGFRLVHAQVADRHWTVATYVSKRPRVIDQRRLIALNIVGPTGLARVDSARPVTTGVQPGTLAAGVGRVARRALVPGWPARKHSATCPSDGLIDRLISGPSRRPAGAGRRARPLGRAWSQWERATTPAARRAAPRARRGRGAKAKAAAMREAPSAA